MAFIVLETLIKAPKEVVFDLSRSIDLHQISTAHTKEEAIAGRMSGLIELGETVTWRAKHLWKFRQLTSTITTFERPNRFTDEMVQGDFQFIKHVHTFESQLEGTRMTDHFEYGLPYGFLGRLVDQLFLRRYLRRLLVKRNETIRYYAESGEWNRLI